MQFILMKTPVPWPLLVLWLVCLGWAIIFFAFLLVCRMRDGRYLFRPQFPDALFTETWTSGRSRQGIARFGGAGNCLWVTVTRDELAVGAHFPFSLMADMYRLDHRIRVADLVSVQHHKPRLGRERAIVTFRGPNPEREESFELILRNLDGFFAAVHWMQSA